MTTINTITPTHIIYYPAALGRTHRVSVRGTTATHAAWRLPGIGWQTACGRTRSSEMASYCCQPPEPMGERRPSCKACRKAMGG